VVLNEHCSSWKDVLSGVPQGLGLGPLLFVVYINVIEDLVNNKIPEFADDIKFLTQLVQFRKGCQ